MGPGSLLVDPEDVAGESLTLGCLTLCRLKVSPIRSTAASAKASLLLLGMRDIRATTITVARQPYPKQDGKKASPKTEAAPSQQPVKAPAKEAAKPA